MFMHVLQQRIQCVERAKEGPKSAKGSREHSGSLLNRHPKFYLSSNLLDSFHGSRLRKKQSKTQHWPGGRSGAHVMSMSVLGARRGPDWSTGWQTLRHEPQRLTQGLCARWAPLPGNLETQHFKSTSASLAPKSHGHTTVWQDRLYLHSNTQNPVELRDAVIYPASEKVLTTAGFLCHYSGWCNTYN